MGENSHSTGRGLAVAAHPRPRPQASGPGDWNVVERCSNGVTATFMVNNDVNNGL